MPQHKLSIGKLSDEFKRYQRQKFDRVGNVEARVLENLCHAAGEIGAFVRGGTLKTEPASDNLVSLNINLIEHRKRKLMGRLLSISAVFSATADKSDPVSQELAGVADNLIRANDAKVDQPSLQAEILEWLLLGGMCIEECPWVENASVEPMPVRDDNGGFVFIHKQTGEELPQQAVEQMTAPEEEGGQGLPPEMFELKKELQETGDFVPVIHGPLSVFLDITTKDIHRMAPDHSLMLATIKTVEWVKGIYRESATKAGFDVGELSSDNDIRIITTNLSQIGDSRSGINIKRLLPLLQGSQSKDDPDMVVVITRYAGKSSLNPEGRHTVFVPGQGILLDQDLPYKDGIPAIAYHWGPVTTNFFTRDWVHDMIPTHLAYSKGISGLREHFNATLHAPMLLGGGLSQEDVDPIDVERGIEGGIGPGGESLVQYATPPALPQGYMEHLKILKDAFDEQAGGADLFRENKFPGQMRGPTGLPMGQEILDTEWGPFFLHFGTRLAAAKQMRLNRQKQFYEGTRLLQYTSKNQQEETLEFKASEVLRAGVDFNVTVDVNSLVPELRTMREERIAARLRNFPQLYTDKRTGQIDDSKLARDLKIGDKFREERSGQYRKLATSIIKRLQRGEQGPPPAPFWDLGPMMDEVEAVMGTDEFVYATSPQIQQSFTDFWGQMSQIAQEQAQQAQQAEMDANMEGIIAQVTQQAASKAATGAVELAQEQWLESLRQQAAQGVDISQMLLQGAGDEQTQ